MMAKSPRATMPIICTFKGCLPGGGLCGGETWKRER